MHWGNTCSAFRSGISQRFFAGGLEFTLWCVGQLPDGNLVLGDKQKGCAMLLSTEHWAWLMASTGAVSSRRWRRLVTRWLQNVLHYVHCWKLGPVPPAGPALAKYCRILFSSVTSPWFLGQNGSWREPEAWFLVFCPEDKARSDLGTWSSWLIKSENLIPWLKPYGWLCAVTRGIY